MRKKLLLLILFIICLMAFNIQSSNSVLKYLGWIYVGSGSGPDEFPKTEEEYSITSVECSSSTAIWDSATQKVIIIPTSSTSNNQCRVEVGEKIDKETETTIEKKEELELALAECNTNKENEIIIKNNLIDAITSASGTIDNSGEDKKTYEYLSNYISNSLYVYPTKVTKSHSEILQQKSTSGTVTFAVPFKTAPSVSKSVSNQYDGMSCSGSVSSVTRFGYKWSLSNSSNRNGTCYLNITFTQS